MKSTKTVGIIGGLGPVTSCNFCLNLNRIVKTETKRQPHLFLDNLPISCKAEEEIIKGGSSKEHFTLIKKAVERFNLLKVDFIAIPCNTVHIFLEKLRKDSLVPILSIPEECAKKCKELNFHKVGLLGSTKTVKQKLHEKELQKKKIQIILPNKKNQQFIDNCIIRIINNKCFSSDKQNLLQIAQQLQNKGAEAIILGCTDLPLLLSKKDMKISLINTLEVLEEKVVSFLVKKKEKKKK